jgi:hypothetical protein
LISPDDELPSGATAYEEEESCWTAIKVLEAAGKVDKHKCQDLVDALIGEDVVVGKNDRTAAWQLTHFLEALPDKEE